MKIHSARMRWTGFLVLTCALVLGQILSASADDRILLHRNGLRGVAYAPLGNPSDLTVPGPLAVTTIGRIPMDGDPAVNVWGGLYPLDVDRDGVPEFVHFNGYRTMRVYKADGTKLWQIDNPKGRVHRDFSHRDTMVMLDATDTTPAQILHCWVMPNASNRSVVLRDAASGAIVKQVTLTGQAASGECQIAAFKTAPAGNTVVLVALRAAATAGCKQVFQDVFSSVVAFDRNLNQLWKRSTCDAGHYVWPLDENADGLAEAMFIGKYLVRPDGTLQCTLSGWGTDHVDSAAVADFDPATPGLETIAVGYSGTRFYKASTCTRRWAIARSGLTNGQYVIAAHLTPTDPAPLMAVRQEPNAGTVNNTYILDAGMVQRAVFPGTYYSMIPMQNANLDGLLGADELVGAYGEVFDGQGTLRLDRSWYWDQQTLTDVEKATLDPPSQWSRSPVIADLDGDGKAEIITWGRQAIVIGSVAVKDPVIPPVPTRTP
ncbi:MAG: hypothetical protein U1E45_11830 [Geminicoccaceae bacterium]